MDSFEEDDGDAEDVERDGGAAGHEHAQYAAHDERLDGGLVRDRDQHRQRAQHHRPHQPAVRRARVVKRSVERVELRHCKYYLLNRL